MTVTILGLSAGALTTGCWAPQIVRSWRTRSTGDLSWLYLLVLATGLALWLSYGILTGTVPVIATNALTLIAVLALAILKARSDACPAASPVIAGVLLDMDGTLVDSDEAVQRCWLQWARLYGVPEGEVSNDSIHGAPAMTTIRRLRPSLSDEAADEAVRTLARLEREPGGVRAATGAGELIAVLEQLGLPWAVVTSADRQLASIRLATAGITPPFVVTLDDVTHGKPDPEGYLAAARRLGVTPSACLVVEDSQPGVAAGHAAGMRVAALRGLPAELRIADLSELAHYLERPEDASMPIRRARRLPASAGRR